MHQWRHHLKNYMKVNRQVACDGINNVQALNYNPKRRGIAISFFSSSSTAAKLVAGLFGVNAPSSLLTGEADFGLNSTLGFLLLSYEDWGDTLTQPLWIAASAAVNVLVTEILDSTPECGCY